LVTIVATLSAAVCWWSVSKSRACPPPLEIGMDFEWTGSEVVSSRSFPPKVVC
jgi:hypothetical protein